MTFTPVEVEQILREQWDDIEEFGGFSNSYMREVSLQRFQSLFGAAVDPYTLIGETRWNDYEEGGQHTLWIKNEDSSLWLFRSGVSVYGEYGLNFEEMEATTIVEWLELVGDNIKHAKEFLGC